MRCVENERGKMSDMRNLTNQYVITPADIEKRLMNLSRDLDSVFEDLVNAERSYHKNKATYEISLARARMEYATGVTKYRVQEIEDLALLEVEELHHVLAEAEVLVKAARANVNRIRTQVDIARSVGSSVRASLEV